MARVAELNSVIAPRAAVQTPAAPASTSTSSGSTDFSSMLQGAMTSGAGTTGTTSTASAAPLARVNATGSVGQRMVQIAAGEVGVAESPPGSNNSPRIAQ